MSCEYKQQWKLFIQFLKDFFDNSLSSVHEENTQSDAALSAEFFRVNASSLTTSSQSDKFKWVRSVESTINKQTDNTVTQIFANQSYLSEKPKKKLKKTLIKPPKSISKAIPGGKYGCAQLLKCCGPLPLRVCSLGLLCLLIQEAISRGILIYYKTLLIKPNQNISFDFNDHLSIFDEKVYRNVLESSCIDSQVQISNEKQVQLQNQQDKSKKVKQAILDILADQQKGVSLARLPKLIQRRLPFTFDLHELGFTKLKQFIQTMSELVIENDGTTHASVILKEFLPVNQNELSPSSYNKKFQTMKDNKQSFLNYFQKNTSVNEYQIKIDGYLKQFLNQNPFGIASQQLLNLLNEKLQGAFDHTLFSCNSFEEYLVKHAETYADVLVKVRGCIVYPKGWQGWVWQQQQLQQQHNPMMISHQKSASTTNQINQIQNSSSQTIKADSFLAGMVQNQLIDNQSLTFHSNNSNPNIMNREFFMIQEEDSHQELDQNLKFIEELLKESDEQDQKKISNMPIKQNLPQCMSLGQWPPYNLQNKNFYHQKTYTHNFQIHQPTAIYPQPILYNQPNSLHSWDFDNVKEVNQ